VRFFLIQMHGHRITAIKNVLNGCASDRHFDERTYIFALADGERVISVEVSYSTRYVTGLWFQTNQRARHGFGCYNKHRYRLKVPNGFYLHSFAGRRCGTGHDRDVTMLSVYLYPLPPPSTDMPKQMRTLWPSGGLSAASRGLPDMRAIVIKLSKGLDKVYALSTRDVAVLFAVFGGLKSFDGQHVVELLPDERVVAVRLVDGVRVQFVTTHRATPWFGEDKDGSQDETVFDVAGKPRGSYICGFHTYTSTDRPKVKKIGVDYWTPPMKTCEKTVS
jgi:hypothetical protein